MNQLTAAQPELHEGEKFAFSITLSDGKTIAIPAARPGERYIGSLIDPNGRMCHSYLLPGDKEKNWDDGLAWAKGLGGDLPSRVEQAMLFAHMPEEFKKKTYWSNTQYACTDEQYACTDEIWYQHFGIGYQYVFNRRYEIRVRAVRRVAI